MITVKQSISLLALGTTLLVASYATALAGPQQTDAQPATVVQDPIRQLNLTPEQRKKIRAIREQLRDERAAVGQRLQESNRTLQNALDADSPDEAFIEQLIKDVASAQAAAMRLRILSEVRIRRVLTPEQIITLRHLQMHARQERRLDRVRRRQETLDGRRGLTNPRGLRPLYRPVLPERRARP